MSTGRSIEITLDDCGEFMTKTLVVRPRNVPISKTFSGRNTRVTVASTSTGSSTRSAADRVAHPCS
jgi:hypothetical protein